MIIFFAFASLPGVIYVLRSFSFVVDSDNDTTEAKIGVTEGFPCHRDKFYN